MNTKTDEQFLNQKDCGECDGTGMMEYLINERAYPQPDLSPEPVYKREVCDICNGDGTINLKGESDEH